MGGLHSLSPTCVSRNESAGPLPIVVPGSFHKGKRLKITKNEKTASVENVRLRNYLRKFGDCHICVEGIVDTFDLSPAKAKEVVQELVKLGLIEPVNVKDGEAPSIYSTTIRGNAFGLASAAKSVGRKSATRILREFLDRVRLANENTEFAYRIESVILFGSYLSGATSVNDVDLSVELVRRHVVRCVRFIA